MPKRNLIGSAAFFYPSLPPVILNSAQRWMGQTVYWDEAKRKVIGFMKNVKHALAPHPVVIFFVDLMSEVSGEKISAMTQHDAKRYSPKILKIDEFALFRNLNFTLLRHPVEESQKYFRGEVPSSRRFFWNTFEKNRSRTVRTLAKGKVFGFRTLI